MQTPKRLVRSWTRALSIASLAACNIEDTEAGDDPADTVAEHDPAVPEQTGSVEQPFAVAGGISAVTTGGTLAPVLGSSTNSAGFLMAIAGNISNGLAIIQPNTGPSSSDTRLWMSAGPGATFRADGGLVIPGSASYGAGFGTSGQFKETKIMSASDPRWRCYLTYICGNGTSAFSHAGDYLRVEIEPGDNSWYLRGSGYTCGSAQCTRVGTHLGWGEVFDPGVYDLGPDYPGKWCWLQGVGGRFRNNNPNDGVIVNRAGGRWQLVVGAGKWGKVECNE